MSPSQNYHDRIAELEERVAFLEGELRLGEKTERAANLCRALRCTKGEAHLLLALYDSGRTLHSNTLSDAIPRRWDDGPENNVVQVMVSRLRRNPNLGHDVIETVWGLGYRLTDSGRQRVAPIV